MTGPPGVGMVILILNVPKGAPDSAAITLTKMRDGDDEAASGPLKLMVAVAFLRFSVSSAKVVPAGKPWPFSSAIQNQIVSLSGPELPVEEDAPELATLDDELLTVSLSLTLLLMNGKTPLRSNIFVLLIMIRISSRMVTPVFVQPSPSVWQSTPL